MNTIFQFPLSATLARRLAEAADGLRNVNQVFFIAGYAFPHPIKDFPDLPSAQTYFSEKGFSENEYSIFGPYKTTDDVEKLNLTGVENIEKVDLTIHFKNGDQQNVSLPGSIDSIFFNLSSFEKFVFPYYCHLYGVEYAKKLRDNLISQYQDKDYSKGGTITALVYPYPHKLLTYMYTLYHGEELPE
jgi:hypothetical protein